MDFKENQVIKCPAPFLRHLDSYSGDFWTHGINFESDGEFEPIGSADGEGIANFRIIKIVDMPKPFSHRILFQKRVIDPDGKIGKYGSLAMLGEKAFKRLSTGGKWNYDII